MIKTHYRDYATEAFRILALEGSAEKFRERIWNEALDDMERRKERNGSISAPTEAAIMRAQKALDDAKATILDLEAAEFALEALEKMRGRAARLNQSRIPQLELYYHTPNGGRRDKKTAARLVGQGVKKGVPDIFIPAQGKGMPGIYIELKVYGNYADKEQNEFLRAVKEQGYYACICYGWRAAAEVVDRFYTRPNDL